MSIHLRKALAHDFPALQQMLELYQHELSDIWPQEMDAQARYGYDLEPHRQAERFHAYVAIDGSKYLGFALVAPAWLTRTDGCWMEQFFVLKRFRRLGVGLALARHVFHQHPGNWELGQLKANTAAQAFWRRTISTCTAGAFVEFAFDDDRWQGVVQQFHVPSVLPQGGEAPGPGSRGGPKKC